MISIVLSFSSISLKSTFEITEKILFNGKWKKKSFVDNSSISSLNKSSYVLITSFLHSPLISFSNFIKICSIFIFFSPSLESFPLVTFYLTIKNEKLKVAFSTKFVIYNN